MGQHNAAAGGNPAEAFQNSLIQGWQQALANFQQLGGANAPKGGLGFDPAQLQALQQAYLKEATELWNQGLNQNPVLKDRRFSDSAWSHNPMAAFSAALYLLNTRTLMGLAQAVQADPKTRERIRFAVEQWSAASAPSNSLMLNAEAQQKAIETKGESIAKGVQNLLHDLRQGHVSMTDESLFEVGKNVATSQGQVVFENDLFQLIEYKPLTAKVHQKPFFAGPAVHQ